MQLINYPGSTKPVPLAPLLMACTKIFWHNVRVGCARPCTGMELCCLCHITWGQRPFKLVGVQQHVLVHGLFKAMPSWSWCPGVLTELRLIRWWGYSSDWY